MAARSQSLWSAERCARLLPKPTRTPTGWKACCPAHDDKHPSLFLADGDDGGLALVCYAGCSYASIADALEAKGADVGRRSGADRYNVPTEHFTLGAYSSHWDYRDARGFVVMRVCRWEQPGGRKDIRPIVRTADGWKWQHHATPRPLYQLDVLTNEADRPVLVCEGEKAATAAQRLFPAYIATTWPGGAQSVGQANWEPLRGREVVLWPDNDAPGRKAMEWVAQHLRDLAASCRTVPVDALASEHKLGEGWDLADALVEQREVSAWVEPPADAAPRIRAEPFVFVPPSQIPPRPWIYGRHYMRGMVSATAGIGGAGKSSVLITEAISMALGKDLFQNGAELPAGAQVVWLHNGEDPMDELQRRFGAALQHYGVDPQQLGNRLRVTSGRTMPIMLAESMSAGGKVLVPTEDGRLLAQELIREKVAALLVDPFVTLHRVSENDNVMIDGVMTVMRNIAHDSMAAIELAHHFRKMNGQEASVDDVRGASSIVGACRSVRIVAPMSKEESDKYGLPEEERRGFIWLQNGKANMLPPTHARRWMQMVSVELGNAADPYDGDKVGVPVTWDPPDARYDLTPPQWRAIRQAIVEAPQPLNNLRYDVRASGWVGKVVAATLEVDLADGTARNNVRGLIERWVKSGRLAVESVRDPKQGRDAQVVRWVDSEAS